ncbi:MAG: S-methyl-5-thioribose-1-phosphate isomerase, partial [Ignavibacteriales bacterium]|nr:S-methyl-5-thioribose-1-phosphate isomerase [Ignavibacteriales bacterium]
MTVIEWCGDSVRLIDQSKLPSEESYIQTGDYRVLVDAIRSLKVRGAPLIGIAAAYGVALAAAKFDGEEYYSFRDHCATAIRELASTRPTAVNLFWSLERMRNVLERGTTIESVRKALVSEALRIHHEDREMCRRIGEYGASLVPQRSTILTHCNTGALATGGDGTAQSIITTAHKMGKTVNVFADETRPLLQGARLTAWELMKAGLDVTLITDSMAASLMKQKRIDLVVVGADRIAANGDVANNLGTYNIAVIARHHGV